MSKEQIENAAKTFAAATFNGIGPPEALVMELALRAEARRLDVNWDNATFYNALATYNEAYRAHWDRLLLEGRDVP